MRMELEHRPQSVSCHTSKQQRVSPNPDEHPGRQGVALGSPQGAWERPGEIKSAPAITIFLKRVHIPLVEKNELRSPPRNMGSPTGVLASVGTEEREPRMAVRILAWGELLQTGPSLPLHQWKSGPVGRRA